MEYWAQDAQKNWPTTMEVWHLNEMGSKNPKVARLGEKVWHGNKEGNDPGIVWRAHIHLEKKNYQCYFRIQHSLWNGPEFLWNATWFYCSQQSNLRWKGAQSAPIFYVNDKREITDTFCVNISGEFLPIQLIYSSCYRLCQEDDFFLPWEITQRLGTGEKCKDVTDIRCV